MKELIEQCTLYINICFVTIQCILTWAVTYVHIFNSLNISEYKYHDETRNCLPNCDEYYLHAVRAVPPHHHQTPWRKNNRRTKKKKQIVIFCLTWIWSPLFLHCMNPICFFLLYVISVFLYWLRQNVPIICVTIYLIDFNEVPYLGNLPFVWLEYIPLGPFQLKLIRLRQTGLLFRDMKLIFGYTSLFERYECIICAMDVD